MVNGSGDEPVAALQITFQITKIPNNPIVKPLISAARDRQTGASASTAS